MSQVVIKIVVQWDVGSVGEVGMEALMPKQ